MADDSLSQRDACEGGRPRFVVVMRHAEVFRPFDPKAVCEHEVPSRSNPDQKNTTYEHSPGACEQGVLSQAGANHARQVGDRLAETLANATANETCIIHVAHCTTAETRRTAQIVVERLLEYRPPTSPAANESPRRLPAHVADSAAAAILAATGLHAPTSATENTGKEDDDYRRLGDVCEELAIGIDARRPSDVEVRVVVVVANDPQASWLLHHILTLGNGHRPWLHEPSMMPIRRGEAIGLELLASKEKRGWRPVWAVSPDSTALIEALQTKIRSKMDSAKQLGAFATALLTFAVAQVVTATGGDNPLAPTAAIVAWAGIGVIAFGVAAFFLALYRYDSLLMPVELWAAVRGDRRKPPRNGVFARPPSSAAWVLFQNMMLVWRRAFTVALAATGTGGTIVAVTLARPSPPSWSPQDWGLGTLIVGGVAGAGLVAVWWASRPVLGVND